MAHSLSSLLQFMTFFSFMLVGSFYPSVKLQEAQPVLDILGEISYHFNTETYVKLYWIVLEVKNKPDVKKKLEPLLHKVDLYILEPSTDVAPILSISLCSCFSLCHAQYTHTDISKGLWLAVRCFNLVSIYIWVAKDVVWRELHTATGVVTPLLWTVTG